MDRTLLRELQVFLVYHPPTHTQAEQANLSLFTRVQVWAYIVWF